MKYKDYVASGKYTNAQLTYIKSLFDIGVSSSQIEILANPDFTSAQIGSVRWGFEKKIPEKKIKIFARPEYDNYVIGLGMLFIVEHSATDEQLSFIENGKYNSVQLANIINGFIGNLSIKQVKLFVDNSFTNEQMLMIRSCMQLQGLSMDCVEIFAKPEFNIDEMLKMKQILADDIPDELYPQISTLSSDDKRFFFENVANKNVDFNILKPYRDMRLSAAEMLTVLQINHSDCKNLHELNL